MPEISRFFGIIIQMYIKDHNPPHFHATYGDYQAIFRISDGEIIDGKFPKKKSTLVTAWSILHHDELLENWNNLANSMKAYKIKPLR